MISFFRRFLTSWAALALLALVLIAFVVTGVHDPFGGGSAAGSLAKVGGGAITETEFQRLWQRAMVKIRQDNPKITPEQAARAGAVDQLLDQTIGSRALETFARRQKIAAPDRMLDAEIAAAPAFQIGGHFDQRTYEGVLAQQRLTDREVRDGLRGDILRRQLLAPIAAGANVASGAAMPYASLILEARQGLIGVIPAAAIKDVASPTQADLAAFYNAHRSAFSLPERRSFRFAVLDPVALGVATPPTEAEIASYYTAHAAQFGATERRDIEQAIVPDEATARRLAAAARAGSFAAAAQSVAQLGAADIAVGLKTQGEFAGASAPAVAAAAFALPQGGVSDPVKSDFGWHVLHVVRIERGAATPLAAARPAIVAALEKDRGAARLDDVSNKLQAAIGKGVNFADLVKQFGLSARTSPALAANAPVDPALKPLLAAAFQSEPADPPSIEDLGQGRAALFQTAEVAAPVLPKLADIAPQVTQAWTIDARGRRARSLAEEVAAEVRAGTPLAAALARRGLPAPQPVSLRRIDLIRPNQRIPPPITALFGSPEGRTIVEAEPQGAFVIQNLKVTPGDPASAPQVVAGLRQQFARLAADELLDQFVRAAGQEVGVRRNAAAIAATRARLSGAGGGETGTR